MDEIEIVMSKSSNGETQEKATILVDYLKDLQEMYGEEAVKDALFEMYKQITK